MGMEVNERQNKCYGFQKGWTCGGNNERWSYGVKFVNVVNGYIYFGFTFTTKLSYREGTSTFAAKGKKAADIKPSRG